MPIQIRAEGEYELFQTVNRSEVLVLDGRQWFSLVEGGQGDALVLTDPKQQKDRTVRRGRFLLVDFLDDPTFKDMPHLFLGADTHYEEVMLPQELPTEDRRQKKVIRTGHRFPKDALEGYLREPEPGAGQDEDPVTVPLPLEGYDDLSAEQIIGRTEGLDRDELVRLRDHEASTLSRKTVLQHLDETIETVERALPIEGYERMTTDEIVEHLDELDEDEMEAIREFEERHRARRTVLSAIEGKKSEEGLKGSPQGVGLLR